MGTHVMVAGKNSHAKSNNEKIDARAGRGNDNAVFLVHIPCMSFVNKAKPGDGFYQPGSGPQDPVKVNAIGMAIMVFQ